MIHLRLYVLFPQIFYRVIRLFRFPSMEIRLFRFLIFYFENIIRYFVLFFLFVRSDLNLQHLFLFYLWPEIVKRIIIPVHIRLFTFFYSRIISCIFYLFVNQPKEKIIFHLCIFLFVRSKGNAQHICILFSFDSNFQF